jgi:hypothetical protein
MPNKPSTSSSPSDRRYALRPNVLMISRTHESPSVAGSQVTTFSRSGLPELAPMGPSISTQSTSRLRSSPVASST